MAASTDYLPSRESQLDDFASQFNTQIVATPTAFGLVAGQATAFTALFTAWHNAFVAISTNTTRTPGAIQTKNDAKDAMVNGPGGIRQLVKIIQAFPSLTNTQRVNLGITVPDTDPSPIPRPTLSPEIDMMPPVVRTVTIRLHNEKSIGRKGKPDGVQGALVFSYVGATPPAAEDTHLWKFEANAKRTSVQIQFPSTLVPGTTVWITAQWYNPRGESGPATPPVYALLPGSLQAAA